MLTLYAGRKCDTGVCCYTLTTAMHTVHFSPVMMIQHRSSKVRSGTASQQAKSSSKCAAGHLHRPTAEKDVTEV
jgi:hypothetical protein